MPIREDRHTPEVLAEEELAGYLALAATEPLHALADAIIASSPGLRVLAGPTVGTARYDVREPVEAIRFGLVEVLITNAEVELEGSHGWATRLGDDRVGTLSAAICDAEVQRNGPLADSVRALCELVRTDLAEQHARRWAELLPTVVHFEELDR